MSSLQVISDQTIASITTKQALLADEKLLSQIESLTNRCVPPSTTGGKIIFARNGDDFADAQHLLAKFISRVKFDHALLTSVTLSANSSAISVIGNDYGYEQVFARELEAGSKPGDLFIAISTSGNSQNILAAAAKAADLGIATLCLTGLSGGKALAMCDCPRMPSNEIARIQECHITIGHIVCGMVEERIFAEAK